MLCEPWLRNANFLSGPSVYPPGFGQSLSEALRQWRPQPTLRQKVELDLRRTDRELFSEIPVSDVWADAELPRVYWYLRTLKCLRIPPSWEAQFQELDKELEQYRPGHESG